MAELNLKHIWEEVSVIPLRENETNNCKGLFFRGYDNWYFENNRMEHKEGFRLLKRKSCPGCEKCGPILADLIEGARSSGSGIYFDSPIKNGELYTAEIEVTSIDYESGFADDWQVEFKLVPNSSTNNPPK